MEANASRQGVIPALTSFTAVSVAAIAAIALVLYHARLVGPTLVLLGFLPWIPMRLSGRTIKSAGADILFGAIDTGLLGVAALIGANLAGVLGAIVGGAVGDSLTDGLAGIFEGRASEHLRRRGIEEARTPLSASMGKMSGCFIGVGITLTVAWSILPLIT